MSKATDDGGAVQPGDAKLFGGRQAAPMIGAVSLDPTTSAVDDPPAAAGSTVDDLPAAVPKAAAAEPKRNQHDPDYEKDAALVLEKEVTDNPNPLQNTGREKLQIQDSDAIMEVC